MYKVYCLQTQCKLHTVTAAAYRYKYVLFKAEVQVLFWQELIYFVVNINQNQQFMKLNSIVATAAFLFMTIFLVTGCRDRSGKIPFDPKNASQHVRPYKLLRSYIDSFRIERTRLYERVEDRAYIDTSFDLADAELFNRDAIIALLNAPGATGIRAYFGKKATRDSTNGNIVLVLLPVDAQGNDIKTRLVVNDRTTALRIPGISTAQASPGGGRPAPDDAEGVEDGQRCPTVCSKD